MIIYANENNPATLKLLIAKEIANIEVDLKIVKTHDRCNFSPKYLPYLECGNDTVLFIPNAAVSYLNHCDAFNSAEVYVWIEWEATVLTPVLVTSQCSSANSITAKNELLTALKHLDKYLLNKMFLVKNTLTNADIIVWSTLYPLFDEEGPTKQYTTDFSNIAKWISKLKQENQFKAALYKYKVDSSTAYQALLAGAGYLKSLEVKEHRVSIEAKGKEEEEQVLSSVEIENAKKAWTKKSTDLPRAKEYSNTILPVAGEENVFITSALPYVNNVPHLGNIIGCVLSADVFARFSRLCNHNTLFICGTDEYGTATETKALEEGISCRDICDKYFQIHRDIYKWFNISFDYFGRTSTPEQTELCQDMFLELNNNGFMFTQSVEQLHCNKCKRFLADRFVEGGCPHPGCNYESARGDQCDGCGKLINAPELKNPRCKICGDTPKLASSNQFFLDLPKLEPLLHHWMQKSSPGWSNNARVIAKSWMKEGLIPRCITRDLKWGVPVPLDGFRNKVFYVWFDAPIGYMSISKAYTKEYKKWWQPKEGTEVKLYQFMAKDNVPFHAVLFPAMLLGTNRGYTTVSHIMATEYLNYEDGKFSKSRGVGVFGNDAQSTGIPSDVWRFYLLYVRPESQDSSFSWDDLVTKANSELLNNLGNFINRTLVFAKNNFNKIMPEMDLIDLDNNVLALCTREYKGYVAALQRGKLRDGIRHMLTISRHGNQYMQNNQPWVLCKGSLENKARAGTIIGVCCNITYLLAMLLRPYLPETYELLKQQLNTSEMVIVPEAPEFVQFLSPGHTLGDPSPLFQKIEVDQIKELKKKFGTSEKTDKKSNVVQENIGKNDKNPSDVEENVDILEKRVATQADKVRKLKTSGVEKSVWLPEVTVLLELKKQLGLAQKKQISGK